MISRTRRPLAAVVVLFALAACQDAPTTGLQRQPKVVPEAVLDFVSLDRASFGRAYSGGATTIFDASPDAFSNPAPNLADRDLLVHEAGAEAFDGIFGTDITEPRSGLGPLFNNNGCASCHIGDGRGRPPLSGEPLETMLFRVSIPGSTSLGAPRPAPGYGSQLQVRAIAGVQPEADVSITYREIRGEFADGTAYSLRAPYYLPHGGYTPFPNDFLLSPRVAPFLHGLGLLEAVPDGILELLADPEDRNRDGISGRTNQVYDAVRRRTAIGRFGLKANVATVREQTAAAYNGDMGITTAMFPKEPCEGQNSHPGCAPHGAELDPATLDANVFYTQTLAVPARRDLEDPQADRGEAHFIRARCSSCHIPLLVTGQLPGVNAVSHQIIRPYTDLLLHDMGPGLSDGRKDFKASGSEWRTPPLWGIGLVNTVNEHTNFLHDGRARDLMEAILWHDGEGAASRDYVRRLPKSDRDALIKFLNSL